MSKLQEMKRNNKIGLLRFYDHEAAVLTVVCPAISKVHLTPSDGV